MYLLGLLVLLVTYLVTYISSDSEKKNVNRSRKIYVAKSQRPFYFFFLARIYVFVNMCLNHLGMMLQTWVYTHCKTKRRITRKMRCKTTTSNKGRMNRRLQSLRHKSKVKPLIFIPLVCMTNVMKQETIKRSHFDTDSYIIRVDNCATRSISPSIDDFIDPPLPINKRIKGLNGTIGGLMVGTIKWNIEDDDGKIHPVILPNSLYIPDATSRLLSPQHWAQVAKDNKPKPNGTWCATYADRIVLFWNQEKYKRTLMLDQEGSNVATIRSAPGYHAYEAFCEQNNYHDDQDCMCYDVNMVSDMDSDTNVDTDNDDSNENYIRTTPLYTDFSFSEKHSNNGTTIDTTESSHEMLTTHVVDDEEDRQTTNHAAEFLQWHHRLGHISPKKIRLMAKEGILPKHLSRCNIPICSSCMFGKMTRRPWRTKGHKNNDVKPFHQLQPGECVSIDQLESTTPGLVAQIKGIPTIQRYKAATIFVDHATRYTYVHPQTSTNAEETVQAKLAFETIAANNSIKIQHYHADNGRFAETKFREAINKSRQTISFCGVNAHFQNGVAERKIRDLQEHARTMLIHATKRWPKAITANLWPYALRVANDVLNETPNLLTGKIPLQEFSKSQVNTNKKHWHTFGCPVYILDNDLQSGKKIDKWSDRSKIGINLGKSPHHAKSVYLVLSLTTGLVSPQFHVKMDDKFDTIRTVYGGNPPISQWQEKCHFMNNKDASVKSSSEKVPAKRKNKGTTGTGVTQQSTMMNTLAAEPTLPTNSISNNGNNAIDPLQASEGGTGIPAPNIVNFDTPVGINTSVESAHQRSPTSAIHTTIVDNSYKDNMVPFEVMASFIDYELVDDTIAYAASKDPDTMYLHEAMRQPDRSQFIEAMKKEVDGQISNGNFALVHIDDVPKNASILPAVWAMRRKRRIETGEIYKWKARLNIDGSKQIKGVNYWDTYAPVASWSIIRLLLILVITKQWKTRQIDYVQAYTQADAETDLLYMKIPKGFTIDNGNAKDYVLSIKKNIYGQKQAGRVWNKHLVQKLKMAGFRQSTVDECVFYHGNCIYMLYTDDSILAGPTDEELDQVVNQMKNVGLDLTVENAVDEFLGVKISKRPNGEFELTQPQLIKNILQDLRLTNDNVSKKPTPACTSQILRRHTESDDFDKHFDYRSVVGKLNYLEKSTRPDISCAVHQCARFVSDPKMEHGKAIKHIGRYLASSATSSGLIFKPDITKSLECFVDSDFSGNWHKDDAADDMDTARSRTGYIIRYAGCPLVWGSKLQTHIALSSTEAEYIAISTAMREVIPLMALMQEMSSEGFIPTFNGPDIHCNVFEDNSGAIEIASSTKYRPRTKHINTQYHHFRYYVDTGQIKLHYIPSKDQLADMLTKSLPLSDLQRLRKRVMGW